MYDNNYLHEYLNKYNDSLLELMNLKKYLCCFSSDGCFDCGEVPNIKIFIQILLHPSPPIDTNRSGNKELDKRIISHMISF